MVRMKLYTHTLPADPSPISLCFARGGGGAVSRTSKKSALQITLRNRLTRTSKYRMRSAHADDSVVGIAEIGHTASVHNCEGATSAVTGMFSAPHLLLVSASMALIFPYMSFNVA